VFFLELKAKRKGHLMRLTTIVIAGALALTSSFALAQGGGSAGGTAGGSTGATGSMNGGGGTGNTSTGIGASPGTSSTNTTGQVNKSISPSEPGTTQPGGPNALPVPNGTVTDQNAQRYDPRLSPGYQK
jgi:hypothetical protein